MNPLGTTVSSEQTAPDGAADSISPDDEYHCDQMAEVTLDVLTSPIKTLGNRPTVTVTPGNKPVKAYAPAPAVGTT